MLSHTLTLQARKRRPRRSRDRPGAAQGANGRSERPQASQHQPSLTLCKSRGTQHSPASVGPHTTGCGRKGLAWLISEPRGEPRGRDPVSPPPVPSAPTHLRSSRFPGGDKGRDAPR